MIFTYPIFAKTVKDIDRFNYLTLSAMSLNLNRLNNPLTYTYRLVDISASELLRSSIDINYYPSMQLDSIDFTTIDRINRFELSKITNHQTVNNVLSFSKTLLGLSYYTNEVYELEAVNSFTDFTRHSIPCDAFLENSNKNINFETYSITLIPNKKYIFDNPISCNLSKITISIDDLNIKPVLYIDSPYIKIYGEDKNGVNISEVIYLTDLNDNITFNEWNEIYGLVLIGVTSEIKIIVSPFIVNKTAIMEFNYVDSEDYFEANSVFSLDIVNKTLNVSYLNSNNNYPAQLEPYEIINLGIPSNFSITSYHFDSPNNLLYVIASDTVGEKYLYAYPINIPYFTTNYNKLQNTQSQSVQISYIRDTFNKEYRLKIFPTNKGHNVDSLNIAIILPHLEERGFWKSDEVYYKGDLVVFNGINYVCIIDTNDSEFNINSFALQKRYIIQNFLLDLINYNIETNEFIIKFDDIFIYDIEAIISVETIGLEECVFQILAQNHALNPCIQKSIHGLLARYDYKNLNVDQNIIRPVDNLIQKLLSNNITSYKYDYNSTLSNSDFIIFTLSSSDVVYINNIAIRNVFKTFFLDGSTNTVITSDTITNIVNYEFFGTDINSTFNKTITSLTGTDIFGIGVNVNDIDTILSDDFGRAFLS